MKANRLVNKLEKAEVASYCSDTLNMIASYALLVIDDFDLMTLDLNKCRNLFEAIDSRDPGRSIIVISQFPVKSWYDLFQEHTYADADY